MTIIRYMVSEIWSATDRIFLSSWAIFCPFTPLTAQKMKILKNDKTPGDIIIKHKWNKNHDHMLYCSWYMVRDRCNCYFSFRAVFCPLVPITAQKIEISKKWKKCLEISSFYKIASKIMIIVHTVPEIWHVTHVIIFHFGQFFALLSPSQSKKSKLKKINKTPGDIIILHMCTTNYD